MSISVPLPIKKLFSTFPLVEYPPIPAATTSSKKVIEDNKYYFGCETQSTSNESFILGVHNVIQISTTSGKFIPSDPVSLGQCLVLCYKNQLKLPSLNNSHNKSNHALMKLSYQASFENELPILIETNSENSRVIRPSHFLSKSVKSKIFAVSVQSALINDLIDNDLYDIWVLSILVDLAKNDFFTLNSIFRVGESITTNEKLNSLTLISILKELPNWNSFKIKYPFLFDDNKASSVYYPSRLYHNDLTEFMTINNKNAINKLYNDQLTKLDDTLDLLIDYVKSYDASSELHHKIIELKLYAFFIIVNQTLKLTKLGDLISQPKFESFLNKAYEIIEKEF